jgi:hypothetical protein
MKKLIIILMLLSLYGCSDSDSSYGSLQSDLQRKWRSRPSVRDKQNLEQEKANLHATFDNINIIDGRPGPYITRKVTVPKGATMSVLGEAAYQDLSVFKHFNVGGVKTAYELSGDFNGKTNANSIRDGEIIKFYSLSCLGLEVAPVYGTSLVARMIDGKIKYNKGYANPN